MGWFILANIFSVLLALLQIGRLSNQQKDLEILILRQQLAILQRKYDKSVKPNRAEKMVLGVLATEFKRITNRSTSKIRSIIIIIQPSTVLRWHRELVRRKWTYQRKNKAGRLPTDKDLESLILRLAKENPHWGYAKIEGELIKLGFKVSRTSIRNILHRHNILPTPERGGSISWCHLMNHYKDQILATDFFTIETITLLNLEPATIRIEV